MRNKNFTILTILIVGVTFFSWWGPEIIYAEKPFPQKVSFLVEVKGQQQRKRSFRDFHFKQIAQIGGMQDTVLLNPIGLVAEKDGSIYVNDYGTFQVKLFRPDGTLERVYGNGKGQGPGEAVNAGDFGVSPNGHVWICDLGLKLNEFDEQGRFMGMVKDIGRPYRISILDDARVAVVPFNAYDDLIKIYETSGRLVTRSGPVMERQDYFSPALAGDIQRQPARSHIVQMPLYAGLLFCFDKQAELQYARRMIAPPEFPKIQYSEKNGASAHGLYFNRIHTRYPSFSITDEAIHVLTSQDVKTDSKQYVIDVYDLQNGDYLYSYHPPVTPLRHISILDNRMYTISNATVTLWTFQ